MFTNLIESEKHVREFKRRSSFFLITVAAYAVILFAAGIASVYAYDAQLEVQTSSLELLNWVPPVTPNPVTPIRDVRPEPARNTTRSNAPVDPNIRVAERQAVIPPVTDPRIVPDDVGIKGTDIPPVTGPVKLSPRNVDPPLASNDPSSCVTCNSNTPTTVKIEEKVPEPPPVKPTTQRVPSKILISKAINLPQPPYPQLAKQIRAAGPVNVQIVVDEQGKVISAQALNGHPALTGAAKEAAMRARFLADGSKRAAGEDMQGMITYNFVLQ